MKYDQNHIKTSSCASANIIIILHQMLLIYSEGNKKNLLNIPCNIYYMNSFTVSLTIQFPQMFFRV